jgi:hypothetical protein
MTATFELPEDIVGLEDYTECINLMIYGDPGVGKTVVAGTAKKGLILATEKGTVAAARQGSNAKVWNAVRKWHAVEDCYEWLYDNVEKKGFPFDWVAIDTITEMQNLALRYIVDTRVTEGKAKNLNPYRTELQEYGEMHEMFKDYVGKFNDLPINTLWLAEAMQVEDEEGQEFRLPSIQGKGYQMAMWTAAQMHAYGYMHMRDVQHPETKRTRQMRSIQWQASKEVRAKDRFDCLGMYTNHPKGQKTLQVLEQKIISSASVAEPTTSKENA